MIDYGLVDAIDAQSIGPPGGRTFRVRVRSGQNSASLWLEKEQLSALARAISQLLAEHSRQRGRAAGAVPSVDDFEVGDVELQVARLGLDFVAEQEHVVMLVDDQEAIERRDTPAFRVEITRAMAMALVESIPNIVAAGRPTCPLCGRPLEGSGEHFCPQTNGHSKDLPIPEEPSNR